MNSAIGYSEGAEVPEDKTPQNKTYNQIEWISVKDRLPTDGEMVVIDWPDNPHFPFVARFIKNHEKQFIIPLRSDIGIEDVTHWMSLPTFPY